MLTEHFRCHPDIAGYCNETSYKDKLEVLTNTSRFSRLPNGRSGLHWEDVSGVCERVNSGGCYCQEEINAVVRIVSELSGNQDLDVTVGVVSPFKAQATRIKDQLEKVIKPKDWNRLNLLVETADGFQGDERDVIIFSICCQPEMPRGSLWFVSQDKNRWNVAVSRAKALLHIVGNLEFSLSSQVHHLKLLAERATRTPRTEEGVSKFESPWERKFFESLREAGLETVPQHPLGGYRMDLAVPDSKLDIEVDGKQFHLDAYGNRKESDLFRDKVITSLGWRVLRFWVYELKEDMEGCVRKVLESR